MPGRLRCLREREGEENAAEVTTEKLEVSSRETGQISKAEFSLDISQSDFRIPTSAF